MNFSVLWSRGAEEDLLEIWLRSRMRVSVEAAAREIDFRLQADPLHQGESRFENLRILLVPPLGVNFVVEPDERRVRVVEVWQFERRSP